MTLFTDGAADSRRTRKRSKSRQSNKDKSPAEAKRSDSPEYMNIRRFSGDGREGTPEKVATDSDVVWRKKAIGPEDRYNDDFSYGQSTFFHEDPLLHEEYGRLLDIRYRAQKEQQQQEQHHEQPQQQQSQSSGAAKEPEGGRSSQRRPMMRREKTWHGDKFQDFQILDKGNNEKVLLTVQRPSTQNIIFPQALSNDKIPWSPVKAFEEIRKVKEAPPKNVVQNRLRQFERFDNVKVDNDDNNSPTFSLTSLETNAERRERFFRSGGIGVDEELRSFDSHLQRKLTEKVRDFALRVEEAPVKERVEELAERESRNFRDLLSDFEKKSRELKMKEEEVSKSASSFHLADARNERRGFSDTETMMYDTSSDDNSSEDKKMKPVAASAAQTMQQPKPAASFALTVSKKSVSSIESEDKYVSMTPPTSKASVGSQASASESPYLTMTPPKPNKKLMQPFSTSSPRASLTASSTSGSIRSLHSRTPSQTLVMEHLQREFAADGAQMISEEESYVDMTDKARRECTLFESRRSESPRYCEIDESTQTTINEEETSLSSAPSHYEYLYQARTATSELYESVYQEIPEEEELAKPMDRLPDILGNTPPVDVQCSRSSDFNDGDETPRETPSAKMMMYASDTFRPASFFLDHSSQRSTSRRSSRTEENTAAVAPPTPSSTSRSSKRKSLENVSMSSNPGQGLDQSKKQGRLAAGLPPDKINLTYRSVYENETSSYSDTDNKNSAASSASLNRDTDGSSSAGAPYYVSELKSNNQENRNRPDSVRSRTPSYVLDADPAVPRTKSLEGLLGDGHAGARDSVRVVVTPSFGKNLSQPISAPSPTMSSYRSTPLPARGREPPPPPPVGELMAEAAPLPWQQYDDDDENRWRESLRRASAEHKARSSPFVRRSVQPTPDQPRSFSVCADPIDPNFYSRQNFLERGLPEGTPETPTRSGRPQATDHFPHPAAAASLQNLSYAPVSASGRRSVAASFAPEAPNTSGFPESQTLARMNRAQATFSEGKSKDS